MPSVLLQDADTNAAAPATKWHRPEKTTHDLPWADIKTIDMSLFDQPGGKRKLAEELRDGVSHLLSILLFLHRYVCVRWLTAAYSGPQHGLL